MPLQYRGTTNLPGQMLGTKRTVPVVWETLEPHPKVMAKTTSAHRQIRSMVSHRGMMLFAYGDWSDNLGPVDVVAYNLETGEPLTVFGPCPTEAWEYIRIIDGDAYLPWVDPRGASHQGGFTTDRTGEWANITVGPSDSMIHTVDIAKIDGRLVVCGSTFGDNEGAGRGVVWCETEPGVWVKALESTYQSYLARFYTFKHMPDGSLVVQVTGDNLQYIGETWSTVDGLLWDQVFDAPDYDLALRNRIQPSPPGYNFHGITGPEFVEYNGYLWAGGYSGQVKRAKLPVVPDPHARLLYPGDVADLPGSLFTEVDVNTAEVLLPTTLINVDPEDPSVAVFTEKE